MVGTRTIRWKCSTRAMLQAVNVSSQKNLDFDATRVTALRRTGGHALKNGGNTSECHVNAKTLRRTFSHAAVGCWVPNSFVFRGTWRAPAKIVPSALKFCRFLGFSPVFHWTLKSTAIWELPIERQLSGIVKIPDNCRSWEFPNSSGLLRRFEFSGGGFTGDDQTNITFVLPNFGWPSAAWDEALGHVSPTNKSESVCRPLFAT